MPPKGSRSASPKPASSRAVTKASSSSTTSTSFINDFVKFYSVDELIVMQWFAIDAFTHFFIEGLYLYFAITGSAEKSSSPLAFLWREYGRADKRWMTHADAAVMSVELPTVLLMGPGALLCLYATIYRQNWKHIAFILVCTIELIGGWYTFAPVWINDIFHPEISSPLDMSSPWLFWVLLVFMNGVWVAVPLVLLCDACVLSIKNKGASAPPPSAQFGTYTAIGATIALYSVLVPIALYLAKK